MAFTVKKYNLEKTKDLLSYIKEDLDSDTFKIVKSKISQLEKENAEKDRLIKQLEKENVALARANFGFMPKRTFEGTKPRKRR